MPKPSLIFLENHHDASTGKVLSLLIPRLWAMGYDCFRDEWPSNETLDDHIEKIEQAEKYWAEIAAELKEKLHVDINDPPSLTAYLNKPDAEYAHFLKRHMTSRAYLPFLHFLPEHNIKYVAIDSSDPNESDVMREENFARDHAKNPGAIGRLGTDHALNVQRNLVMRKGLAAARAGVCFFDLNKKPGTYGEAPPIEITQFIASGREEEAVELIIKKIAEKQAEMEKLAQPLVSKSEESVSGWSFSSIFNSLNPANFFPSRVNSLPKQHPEEIKSAISPSAYPAKYGL